MRFLGGRGCLRGLGGGRGRRGVGGVGEAVGEGGGSEVLLGGRAAVVGSRWDTGHLRWFSA